MSSGNPFDTARRLVAEFIDIQRLVGRAPGTLEAYRADLANFIAFGRRRRVCPLACGPGDIARYAGALLSGSVAATSVARSSNPARAGLATATVRRRLSSVRTFFEHVVAEGERESNPVRRGSYARHPRGGRRGLVPSGSPDPWIPDRDEWVAILTTAVTRAHLRTLVMLLVQYDGALRRGELVALRIGDVLPLADRQVRVRGLTSKSKRDRVVSYSDTTATLLKRYLDVRYQTAESPHDPLFVSEGPRNRRGALGVSSWSKSVEALADASGLASLSTHTMRHLRLTHLAMAGWDLHELRAYAGHQLLESTMLYIHLSRTYLRDKYATSMRAVDAWMAHVVGAATEVRS